MKAFDYYMQSDELGESMTEKHVHTRASQNHIQVPIYSYFFSVVVNENNPATLECSARGIPPPRIEWRRENNAILPTGGVIYR